MIDLITVFIFEWHLITWNKNIHTDSNVLTLDDAGPVYNPEEALSAYRKIYTGPINLGFEVGQQAWGGAILKENDVLEWTKYTVNEDKKNGIFIWSLQKKADFDATGVINLVAKVFTESNDTSTIVPFPTKTATTTSPTVLSDEPKDTVFSDASTLSSYIFNLIFGIALIV